MPIAARLAPFGTSVFAEITARAQAAGAVNLGQGAPDFDGPDWLKEAAARALHDHPNQYAPMPGLPALRRAVAQHWHARTGLHADPDREVTITVGATGGLASACLGLLNPGDEVIAFEPFYDAYPAAAAFAGAALRCVTLEMRADGSFGFEPADLERAVSPRTRAILLNTPHNPTGKVFSRAELETIADTAARHGLMVIADEVYDHLVYEGTHTPIATLPAASGRVVTLGSFGKTFSMTGWKIGWAIAPADLTAGVRGAHQFLNFAVATPLQHAAAEAVPRTDEYARELVPRLAHARGLLAHALRPLGLRFAMPAGGYFILADHRDLSARLGFAEPDDVALCHRLIDQAGVATIPPTAFYAHKPRGRHLLRIAFCKRAETITAAAERLARFAGAPMGG